jgi:4-hydroxybenzoate polyprenyltransferase
MLFVYPHNLKTLVYFFVFSLASSAAYLVNDILDKEEDLSHPVKSLRPVASGKINMPWALAISFSLGLFSLGFSFWLSFNFGIVIAVYMFFNILYTKILKRIPIIDVFCIGLFFLLRIIAGSISSEVTLSRWIIIMVVLLAVYLGFNKRRQEVKISNSSGGGYKRFVLKRYNVVVIDKISDLTAMAILGAYLLYTVNIRTVKEFGSNHLLYTVPFVFYGVIRYRNLIRKSGEGEGDPTRIFTTDRVQQLNVLLWLFSCIGVIYFGF